MSLAAATDKSLMRLNTKSKDRWQERMGLFPQMEGFMRFITGVSPEVISARLCEQGIDSQINNLPPILNLRECGGLTQGSAPIVKRLYKELGGLPPFKSQ